MNIRRRWWVRPVAAGMCLLLWAPGCSNVVVKKVPLEKRIEGRDSHVKGFRYYLSRPYFAVTDRVPVATRKTLVYVQYDAQNLNPKIYVPPADGRAARAVSLSELKVASADTGAVRRVTSAELERLKRAVIARRDDQLRAAAATTEPASATNSVTLPAGGSIQVPPGTKLDLPTDATVQVSPPPPMLVTAPTPSGTANELSGTLAANAAPAGTATETPDTSQFQMLTPTAAPAPAALATGPIQVVFLPDFDEQYAIRSKNCLAKSAFSLSFGADSTLSEVQGQHDATTVTISLLQQVQSAITAAKGVFSGPSPSSTTNSVTSTKTSTPTKPGPLNELPKDVGPVAAYYLVETCYIQPGLYRLNKPWEMTDPDCLPHGTGLLAKLGLPVVTDVNFIPATAGQ